MVCLTAEVDNVRELSQHPRADAGTRGSEGPWLPHCPWVYLEPENGLLFSAICKASSDNLFVVFLAFLLWGDGFDRCLLYNVMNLHP